MYNNDPTLQSQQQYYQQQQPQQYYNTPQWESQQPVYTQQYQNTGAERPYIRSSRIEAVPHTKLFVGNLAWATDETSLQNAFGAYGIITESVILRDRESGRSRGFGFVTYSTPEEAQTAIGNMNGRELDGRNLRVNLASERAKVDGVAGAGSINQQIQGGGASNGYSNGGGGNGYSGRMQHGVQQQQYNTGYMYQQQPSSIYYPQHLPPHLQYQPQQQQYQPIIPQPQIPQQHMMIPNQVNDDNVELTLSAPTPAGSSSGIVGVGGMASAETYDDEV
ncbi:hypothetical protein SmJEL517_g05302 [Synchytrium microbalum]|uniref:RRM domain-containing protein n=1 Tax=Synchytrium microbalum TaxID=1806994 RepID=A0A507BWT6_9FUNG|nr:uncharacterized protein SmJEL517_g05302 [Synchytrium microbalum]TPX31339.1 hypothetical protein SmJEL517_g05302 [Synchytrium microbalum]